MTSLLKGIRFEDIVKEEEEEEEREEEEEEEEEYESPMIARMQNHLCYFIENSLPLIDKTALECLTYLWPTQLSVIKGTIPLLSEYLLVKSESLAILQDHC